MSEGLSSGQDRVRDRVPALAAAGDVADLECVIVARDDDFASDHRATLISYLVATLPKRPLGQILPFQQPDGLIPYHQAPVRVQNCFRKNRGIETWGDLSTCSVENLFATRSAGRLSVNALIDLALIEVCAQSAGPPIVRPLPEAAQSPGWERWSDFQRVAEWSQVVFSTAFFGDVFNLKEVDSSLLPVDVAEAWLRVEESPLGLVAAPEELNFPLGLLPVMRGLTDREHDVFCRRVLAHDTPTLEEVGREFGVTRERIRQLQKRAESAIREALAHSDNRQLAWCLHDLKIRLGQAFPISMLDEVIPSDGSEDAELARSFALWLAGPFHSDDGWLLREDVSLATLWQHVHCLIEDGGQIEKQAAVAALVDNGIVERAAAELIRSPKDLIAVGSTLFPWSGSVANKAEVVLQLLGRPATDEELVDHIAEGHSRRSLRNRLMEEERFMRTDRDLFAMRSWGLEEYSGISEEIAERIERAGGEALLEDVVRELLDTFDVAESSVRQYAAAHRFVQDNGFIRVRSDEEIAVPAVDPTTVAGVYRPSGDRLLVVFDVTTDILRGSGRSLSRPIAVALGATPGHEVGFVAEGPDEVRVMWRLDSASGPTIGSLASSAHRAGAGIGDQLLLDFHLARSTAQAYRVASRQLLPVLRELFEFRDGDDLDLVALALGVQRGSARSALRRRSDDSVLQELPTADVDDSLKSALEGLTDVLGDVI